MISGFCGGALLRTVLNSRRAHLRLGRVKSGWMGFALMTCLRCTMEMWLYRLVMMLKPRAIRTMFTPSLPRSLCSSLSILVRMAMLRVAAGLLVTSRLGWYETVFVTSMCRVTLLDILRGQVPNACLGRGTLMWLSSLSVCV